MKTNRLLASAIVLLALALLLSQSAGAGAQTAPRQSPAQAAKPGAGSGFSATLSRPNDQAPYKITFQARLTNPSGQPITSPTNFTFRIYTVPSGGTAIFTEGPVSITPNAQGLLTYQVGSGTTIDPSIVAQFANSLYLGVQVGSDPEMTPRLLLTASPYAMSLAAGAVVSGSYSGTSDRYGVVNAINTDLSSSNNAGLYAQGATAVNGLASSSGNTSGYGGLFYNNGGGSGYQEGVHAEVHSNGSSQTSSAGRFINFGGGGGQQYGVFADSPGYGLYGNSSSNTNQQQSAGVVGQSGASGGAGGVFTGTIGVNGSSSSSGNTSGYGGLFYNNGGGSGYQEGVHAEVHSSGSSQTSSAGRFINFGGGGGQQYGVYADSYSTGGTYNSYGGYFLNHGGGSGQQFGIRGETTSVSGTNGYGGYFANSGGGSGTQYGIAAQTSSTGGNIGYGGYFNNDGGGIATQYGIYSYAPTSGGPGGFSGYFDSNSTTDVSVLVKGKVVATGGCCASAFYDIQVKYHGTAPLHPGDVVAMDGNNETVDGTPTLGVVKATATNAKAAVGVVQYRMKKIGTEKDGHGGWQVDEQATSFGSGDVLSAVVLGQVHMKVAGGAIGDRIILDAAGNAALASDDSKYPIGKVASPPDKDGYVTVFVNLK
ncbi:MAG: hypothetical protein DLM69_00660 [Candidatus Chloroheliales bacterium]|nr:MAG: hypothetical protein DLM69_00660 [Chloroflexota bacterium]